MPGLPPGRQAESSLSECGRRKKFQGRLPTDGG